MSGVLIRNSNVKVHPPPDFFLKATEISEALPIRGCWVKGKLVGEVRPDCLWVGVDPPVRGLDGATEDVRDLVLATRHVGASLDPVNESPVYVYVYRTVRNQIFLDGNFKADDVVQLTWGEVYLSFSAAEAAK